MSNHDPYVHTSTACHILSPALTVCVCVYVMHPLNSLYVGIIILQEGNHTPSTSS